MELSIIIPAYNEEDSIFPLIESIIKNIKDEIKDFEIIIIDDGSTDNTWKNISKISSNYKNIFPIKLLKNYGKSDALDAGFKSSKGRYIITMDADLQDDPSEILPLLNMIKENNMDLVSGWKKKRNDPISKIGRAHV